MNRMFWILLRTQMHAFTRSFRKNVDTNEGKKNTNAAMLVVYAIALIYVGIIVEGALVFLFYTLEKNFYLLLPGEEWIVSVIGITIAIIVAVLFSVLMMEGTIYNAKDNELLLSMPIPKQVIVAVRLINVYLLNLGLTVLALGAMTGVRFYLLGFDLRYLLCIIVACIFVAMFSTTISCVLGFLLALLLSRLRSTTIMYYTFALAFILAYLYMTSHMEELLAELISTGRTIAESVREVLFPIYYCADMIENASPISFLITFLCMVIPFVLAFVLLSWSFERIVTRKVGGKKKAYKAGEVKAHSQGYCLFMKELKRTFGTPIYLLNGGLGCFMPIALGIVCLVKSDIIMSIVNNAEKVMGSKDIVSVPIAGAGIAICISISILSASAISLEGKSFWILKSLPISTKTILYAKTLPHLTMGVVGALIGCICVLIAFPVSAFDGAFLFLYPLLTVAFCGFAGTVINVNLAKFDWKNETTCVKQSMSTITALLVNTTVCLTPIAVYSIGAVLYPKVLATSQGIKTAMILGIVWMLIASVLAWVLMLTKSVRKFDKLAA